METDVTLKARQEEQQAKIHQAAIDAVDEMLLFVDNKKDRVTLSNQSFSEFVGVPLQEIVGKSSTPIRKKLISIRDYSNITRVVTTSR